MDRTKIYLIVYKQTRPIDVYSSASLNQEEDAFNCIAYRERSEAQEALWKLPYKLAMECGIVEVNVSSATPLKYQHDTTN